MDAATKIAKQRLNVLELAEILGNVSETCRRRGIDRKRAFAKDLLDYGQVFYDIPIKKLL